jgi:NADH-quinone oxidoreductase subunit C/D
MNATAMDSGARTTEPEVQGGTAWTELEQRFGPEIFIRQATYDGIPTFWIPKERLREVLNFLKQDIERPFAMLFDLTAMDERLRQHRQGLPESDFTVVYHLLSYGRNEDIRLKVALSGDKPSIPSIAALWPNANWYEREAYDMFGIRFEGHPNLRRILMPPTWKGHPLRKDHPARATEMGPFTLPRQKQETEQQALRFVPEDWGMKRYSENSDFLFLNLGPNHPSVHGVFRVALQLDGEEIVDAVPDIGYHHRAAEKMGERQSWHTYIPYTDRVDYLGGSLNNLPYVMALEKMAGIRVPERAQVIRVLISEFYRINNHLLFYGTFAQDVGQLSPVFYMFIDREKAFEIIEGITGGRLHSSFFRIGGTALDLPQGWDKKVLEFCDYFLKRLDHYDRMVLANSILQRRTQGIGVYGTQEAIAWGATGPGLRATGFEWDCRKQRPYSGYENFEFEVPTGRNGDCYDRCLVRVEEMRQSVRIIRQCVAHMPSGPHKADHPLTTPPPKARTMHDIETLIQHFLNVSWGPVMPAGETFACVEATKGLNGYYLTSDGGPISYRTRIRTPSFPHLQMIPLMCRGLMIADLIAILGSIDFVMADVDR